MSGESHPSLRAHTQPDSTRCNRTAEGELSTSLLGTSIQVHEASF